MDFIELQGLPKGQRKGSPSGQDLDNPASDEPREIGQSRSSACTCDLKEEKQ